MTDVFSKKKRSEIMRSVKSEDTKIEVAFRKELWKKGFRYSKNSSNYFGKPDVVLKKYKTMVFIDSCFWHGCKKHLRMPDANKKYWENKIGNNIKRSKAVNKELKRQGLKVIRIWEHEIDKNLNKTITKVNKIIYE